MPHMLDKDHIKTTCRSYHMITSSTVVWLHCHHPQRSLFCLVLPRGDEIPPQLS
ncbi:hypothetical protein BDZ94DRAFT_1253033 [Collybia nuda]|uniref:Uncharacterized protein n=1 Tax=Collybia nuda TaxID=64659 RepID=A0A9P6CMI3_9AGAR|nr:hypothetical protein BDZ94DRAFT_1253033 [Collybia nuda]